MASNLARLEEVSRQSQKGVRSHHNWKLRRRGRDAEDGEIAKPCGGRRLTESGDCLETSSSFSFLRLPSLHHTAPLSFLPAIISARRIPSCSIGLTVRKSMDILGASRHASGVWSISLWVAEMLKTEQAQSKYLYRHASLWLFEVYPVFTLHSLFQSASTIHLLLSWASPLHKAPVRMDFLNTLRSSSSNNNHSSSTLSDY